MFGRNTAKIKALENVIKAQSTTIKKLEDSEFSLMAEIREMDQLIFQMGQQTSWGAMLPYYRQLQSAAETRQRAESDRIATVLIPEMKKAYR